MRALQVQVVATRAAENEQKQIDDLNNDKLETITLSGNETISSSWEVSYDADKQIYRVFGGKIACVVSLRNINLEALQHASVRGMYGIRAAGCRCAKSW